MKTPKSFLGILSLAVPGVFLFSGMALAASAPVIIGGEELSSTSLANTAGTATYDPNTNTLTLNGYSGTGIKIDPGATKNFTIYTIGENNVEETGNSALSITADNCIIKGEPNSKLTLSTGTGTVLTQTGIVTIEDGSNLILTGKEGIMGNHIIVNGGKLKIDSEGSAILIDNGDLTIGNANIALTSTKAYGIDLRNKSRLIVEGGTTTINADLDGINLSASGTTSPDEAQVIFNNGVTSITSKISTITLDYTNLTTSLANGAGLKLGDGMFIVEDDVFISTAGNITTLAQDKASAKTVTIKQITNPEEGNSKTGDNIVIYMIILVACAGILALKFRPTSRF